MWSRKSLSPLIATILLVGFTIILAAAFYKWVYVLFVGVPPKPETCNSKAFTLCSNVVGIKVLEVVPISSNSINISVRNNGQYIINGIKFSINGQLYTFNASNFMPSSVNYFEINGIIKENIKSLIATPRIMYQDETNCEVFCDDKNFKFI